MNEAKNLIGKTIGIYTVIERIGSLKEVRNLENGKKKYRSHALWLVVDEKGNEYQKTTTSLTAYEKWINKKGKSYKQNATRNKYPRRLMVILNGIKNRCLNPNDDSYSNYGGRGITISQDWLNNSENFYKWALNNGYNDQLSIDRINFNGNYEPSNCRWVTIKEQQRNKRTCKFITHGTETHCVSEWAEILNLSPTTVHKYIKRGCFEKLFIA